MLEHAGAVLALQLATRPIWCRAVKFSDQLKALKDPKVLKVLPVLQHRVRQLHWPCRCGWCSTTRANTAWTSAWRRCWPPASRCQRRAARHRRRALGQVQRAQRHLVGDIRVCWIIPVPAVVPADGLHRRHRGRPGNYIGLNVYVFTALMFAGHRNGFDKASVFKATSATTIPATSARSSGIVGLAGGMSGFILPIMFGAISWTGRASAPALHACACGVVWVSLIWMYFTEVRRTDLVTRRAPQARYPASADLTGGLYAAVPLRNGTTRADRLLTLTEPRGQAVLGTRGRGR